MRRTRPVGTRGIVRGLPWLHNRQTRVSALLVDVEAVEAAVLGARGRSWGLLVRGAARSCQAPRSQANGARQTAGYGLRTRKNK